MPARLRNTAQCVLKAAPGLDTVATVSVSTTAPALTFTVASRTVVLLQGMRQVSSKDSARLLATECSFWTEGASLAHGAAQPAAAAATTKV